MTSSVLTWSEIVVGDIIPPLTKKPTYMQLFMFSAITWNRHLIHYNAEYARRDGLSDVATHRALLGNFLAQMLCDWIGDSGRIRRIEWNVRSTVVPGDTIICHGVVLARRIEGATKIAECDIWIENKNGENIAPGKCELIFFN